MFNKLAPALPHPIPPRLRGASLLLVGLIVVLLFHLGAQPVAVNLVPAPWDKLAHFATFGVLGGLLWLGAGGAHPLLMVILASAIGGLDEWHQAFLPGRSADLTDLLADCGGVIAIIPLCGFLARNRSKPTHPTNPTNPAQPGRPGAN